MQSMCWGAVSLSSLWWRLGRNKTLSCLRQRRCPRKPLKPFVQTAPSCRCGMRPYFFVFHGMDVRCILASLLTDSFR